MQEVDDNKRHTPTEALIDAMDDVAGMNHVVIIQIGGTKENDGTIANVKTISCSGDNSAGDAAKSLVLVDWAKEILLERLRHSAFTEVEQPFNLDEIRNRQRTKDV